MLVLAVGSAPAGICHYCDNHHANLQEYYRFYLRDYQGNNRLTYTAAGAVLDHYTKSINFFPDRLLNVIKKETHDEETVFFNFIICIRFVCKFTSTFSAYD